MNCLQKSTNLISKSGILTALFLLVMILPSQLKSQEVSLKTNALYWATTTPNLSVEFGLGKKTTLEILGGYNPWRLSNKENNKKVQHWIVQPEFRLWTCEKFIKSFFGFHTQYLRYNAGGVDLPLGIWSDLKDYRYEGYGVGAGFSYGHQWYLGPHWNIEATFGFGYNYLNYKKFDCVSCGVYHGREHRHYFGPTKVAVSFVYLFKSAK